MERRDKVNSMIDGDEYDILTPYRNRYKMSAGVAKEVKRRFNKRNRKKVEEFIDSELCEIYDYD